MVKGMEKRWQKYHNRQFLYKFESGRRTRKAAANTFWHNMKKS